MAGFELTESLAGRLRLARDGNERPIAVTICCKSGSIASFLRHPTLALDGLIEAPGLAAHRPLAGSIDATQLFTERRLAYAFTFAGDDGATYAFAGEKSFVPRSFIVSFTLLAGAIHDPRGGCVGDVLLRFNLRGDLLAFAQSLRFTR